jgi:FkbM family methyltransferase
MNFRRITSLPSTLRFITTHPLNQGQRVRALFRYLKWQVGSRLVPGEKVFHWIDGAKMVVRPGDTGFTGNIYAGLHEFPDMAYVLHVMDKEDLFIDVGANVGSYTVLACASRGARGYCFEPIPSTFERLARNLRENGIGDRVRAMNIGVGETEEVVEFACSDDDVTNHVAVAGESAGQTLRVKVLPLDTVLRGESPTMLKIDVEGFETRVVNGAQAVLRRNSLHSVIMELNGFSNRYGFSEDHLVATMVDLGFHPYSYDPFSRNLQRLAGKNPKSGNTLFIRDERLVAKRIAGAPLVSVGRFRF